MTPQPHETINTMAMVLLLAVVGMAGAGLVGSAQIAGARPYGWPAPAF